MASLEQTAPTFQNVGSMMLELFVHAIQQFRMTFSNVGSSFSNDEFEEFSEKALRFVIFLKMAVNKSILSEEDDHEDYPGDSPSSSPSQNGNSHIKKKENSEPSRKKNSKKIDLWRNRPFTRSLRGKTNYLGYL